MRVVGRAAVLAGLLALVLGGAAPAFADHLDVATSEPASVSPGDIVEIAVVVRSSVTQQPVADATVVVSIDATIVGVSGPVEIARARTGDDGTATLRWQVRSGATESVLIAYSEAGDVSLESEPLQLVTVGAGQQIVHPEPGLSIPGLGAWVLIGVLVLAWALIQSAMIGPVRVARAGARHMSAAGVGGGDDE